MEGRFLNCDCMEGMKAYPDDYFDLAIVDPPYFEDYGRLIYTGAEVSTTGIKRNRYGSQHWDVPGTDYFSELFRVSRNQIIWGINYFGISSAVGSGRIVWDKRNDTSSFSKCEIAYCSFHRKTEIFRYRWNGMIQENMKQKEKRIHPTQKPVALYEWLLNMYAKRGDVVLDTHVGSGSSLIACNRLSYEYVGFEINPGYYEKAVKRIQLETQQLRLTDGLESYIEQGEMERRAV